MLMRRLWFLILFNLLMVSVASAATVTIAWTAPTTNTDTTPLTDLASYNLYRCTGSACTPTLLTNVGLVTVYQDITIVLGTIYRYRITALDTSSNEGPVSNTIEIGPPPAPTGITLGH